MTAWRTKVSDLLAGEELIPSQVAYALLDGENPIRVWREYRKLTQQLLAEKVGISKPYLSQIESGKRNGTSEILKRLAQVLNIDMEDLVETNNDPILTTQPTPTPTS